MISIYLKVSSIQKPSSCGQSPRSTVKNLICSWTPPARTSRHGLAPAGASARGARRHVSLGLWSLIFLNSHILNMAIVSFTPQMYLNMLSAFFLALAVFRLPFRTVAFGYSLNTIEIRSLTLSRTSGVSQAKTLRRCLRWKDKQATIEGHWLCR